MEQGSRVQTKITAEGLVLEISTKNERITTALPTANNYYSELNTNRRLNCELSTILKFTKLPNSLLELSTAAHNFYTRKYSNASKVTLLLDHLRTSLSLLVNHSCASIPEASSRVHH